MLAEIQSSSLQSTSFQSFTSPAPIPNPFISSDSPSQTPVISSSEPTDLKIENSTEDPSTTDQKLYEESLNLALKESMNEAKVEQKTEIIEVLENTEDKVEDTAADLFGNDLFEEEEEKLVEGVTDEQRKEVKKRMMSQRKLKKMQAKNYAAEYKTQAYKDNLMYSTQYSPPMYKNIVNMAKEMLDEFEKSLSEEISEEVSIISRLSKLADIFFKESKSAKEFDRTKIERLFKELASLFKSEGSTSKVTQYELYKSKIVDALHSFLTLPTKEEESKSSEKSDSLLKNSSKEYQNILSRYMCLIEVFCKNQNNKVLKSLIATLENSVKTSFGIYFQQELTAYYDGVNLAYDLKKYSKRNRLQLVYEPNIENKILSDEALEQGLTSKKQLKDYFAKNRPINSKKVDEKNYEDTEFLNHFPQLSMDKTVSKQEKPSDPLIEEVKDSKTDSEKKRRNERSLIYQKRDALYKELKAVNVSVENSSTLEVIKDFLRNRICKRDHIKQLKASTDPGYMSDQMHNIFDLAKKELDRMGNQAKPGDFAPNLQDMFNKIMIDSFGTEFNENISESERQLIMGEFGVKNQNFSSLIQSAFTSPPSTSQPSSSQLPNENIKEEEEEEKITTSPPSSETLTKTRAISEAFSDVRPLNDDEGSLGEEMSEEDQDEPGYSAENKEKLGLFGKLKKFFFKDTPTKKNERKLQENEEMVGMQNSEEKPKFQEIQEDAMLEQPKLVKKESAPRIVREEKKNEERDRLIDDPLILKDLDEDQDVIFEFYYNRIKVSSLKTVYELINYQPTHRTIVDSQIVYFKIKDREVEDESKSSTTENKLEEIVADETSEEGAVIQKHKMLIKSIKENSKDLIPSVAYFMSSFISPYVLPDPKKPENVAAYYSPYSYNAYGTSTHKSSIKIGESSEEQRLV